jgi:hypothetical protein
VDAASKAKLDALASETWPGVDDPRLAAAWSHLQHQADGHPNVRKEEARRTESTYKTETTVLEDYAGRYPIELLQNAQDAAAEAKKSSATVWMHVSDSALLVGNEGRPFDDDRVTGLLNLAVGTKSAADAVHHTIGYKGIGFTSVFEITDRPQIFSTEHEFCLDASRAHHLVEQALGQELVGVPRRRYAFPIDWDDVGADKLEIERMRTLGAVTVIRLPFSKGSGLQSNPEGARRFVESVLSPEVLLFMPALSVLCLTGQGPDKSWSIKRGKRAHGGRLVTIDQNGRDSEAWLLYERRAELDPAVTANVPQEVWRLATHVGAAVAVPWKRGRPDPTRGPRPLHVYFPTSDATGRALLIHGDFYVHSDRTRIHTAGNGGKVTDAVADLIADLIADVSMSLASFGGEMHSCIAPLAASNGFGTALNDIVDQRLSDTSFVRTATTETTKAPRELRCLGPDTSREDAALITTVLDDPKIYLHPSDGTEPQTVEWLHKLGLKVAEPTDVFEKLRPSAGAKVPSYDRLLSAFGRYRDLHGVSSWQLRNCTVVQNEDKQWVTPNETVRRVAGVPALPAIAAVAAVRTPRADDGRDFVDALDLQDLDASYAGELVVQAAMSLDANDRFSSAQLLSYLHKLWRAHKHDLTHLKGRAAVRVPCRSARGKTTKWLPAAEAYFSSDWTPDRSLEQLFGGLGEKEFLAKDPLTSPIERGYFEWLGVGIEPRIWLEHPVETYRTGLAHYEWMREVGVPQADPCSDAHPDSGRRVARPWLDRFDELIGGSRTTRETLARFVGRHPELIGPATVRCTNFSHDRKSRRGRTEGQIGWAVRSTEWLPASDEDGTNVDLRPTECWIELPESRAKLALPTVDLSGPVGDVLGCGNPRRPSVESLSAGLMRLATRWPEPDSAPPQVADTAEWLFAHLHGALKSRGALTLTCSILSMSSSGRCWSSAPLLADVEGLEVLSGVEWITPQRHSRTYRALGLRLASEIIKSRARPIGKKIRDDVLTGPLRVGLYALLEPESDDVGRLGFRIAKLDQVTAQELDVELTHEGRTVRAPQPAYLNRMFDKKGRLNGAELLLRSDWRDHIRSVAGRVADYLEEPELTDRVLHFLDDPESTLRLHGVGDDALADAEAALRKYRRREPEAAPVRKEDGSSASDDEAEAGPDQKQEPGEQGPEKPAEKAQGPVTPTGPAKPRPQKRSRQKQRRLITYVPPPGTAATEAERGTTEGRKRSDRMGIAAVLEYEQEAGRFAKEMPHHNKGFDIESYATSAMSGTVERYIEVKSIADDWGETNVRLSKAQLEFATGPRGSQSWLYVVEHAQSPEPIVHAVARVGQRADSFYFDHGWKALSEDPEITSETVLEDALQNFVEKVQPLLAGVCRLGAEIPVTVEGPIDDLPEFSDLWTIEAAWVAAGVGLVTDSVPDRDEYLIGLGWTVLRFEECSIDTLADALDLPDGDNAEALP